MKIAVWSGTGRIGPYTTGVGKHIINMTRGLSTESRLSVQLLLSADNWTSPKDALRDSPLSDIPGIRLPLRRRQLEVLWETIRWPSIDLWANDADWVYCPKELYIPVRRARYALTVHDLYVLEDSCNEIGNLARTRKKIRLRRALSEATIVVSVSEFTKNRIVEMFRIDPDRIQVVGNGVEEHFFHPPKLATAMDILTPNENYLLSVGGLTRKKGGQNLLKFATVLSKAAPDIRLLVVGPVESEFERPLSSAINLRLMQRGLSTEIMHQLVHGAMASLVLSEYEGFGIPILESMAAGVPVIAARRSALPEVIGDAGILVDPTDSDEVLTMLAAVRENNGFRSELIEKGKRRARQFTWESCLDRLLRAMQDVAPNSVKMDTDGSA